MASNASNRTYEENGDATKQRSSQMTAMVAQGAQAIRRGDYASRSMRQGGGVESHIPLAGTRSTVLVSRPESSSRCRSGQLVGLTDEARAAWRRIFGGLAAYTV